MWLLWICRLNSKVYKDLFPEREVLKPRDEKITGIVGMSQWITANTCCKLGGSYKEYELIES